MAYLEFEIPTRSWGSADREILFAKMSQIGFDGFIEGDDIIKAYINEKQYSGNKLNKLIDELSGFGINVQYRFHKTEDQNWNEEWEKKFEPVVIDGKLLVRAPFHGSSADLPYTLVIEPKMSFGTGHHITTRLMIREMMKYNLKGRAVLDMGCGTGILGIYACKLGAERVLGIDYDQWAYKNALENVERNGISIMEVRLGDVGIIGDEFFDFILANITRNTLVREISDYASHLIENGIIVASGILAEDVQYVLNAAYQCGLNHLNTREESNWISLSFVKQVGS